MKPLAYQNYRGHKVPVYGCPTREITDAELELIYEAGLLCNNIDKKLDKKLPGDEWKDGE